VPSWNDSNVQPNTNEITPEMAALVVKEYVLPMFDK
jgi:hypothetical protein